MVSSNLEQRTDLRHSADFDALKRLVDGLMELASLDLRGRDDDNARVADLQAVIDQLRVVIELDWDEIGGEVTWDVPAALPPVAANAHGLLQIFLNLCQNSLRAVGRQTAPQLRVSVAVVAADVVVTFADDGPGVAQPDQLFHLHPTRSSSEGTGLGLYISRELARSVGGDLRHLPTPRGASFQVVVPQFRHAAEDLRAS